MVGWKTIVLVYHHNDNKDRRCKRVVKVFLGNNLIRIYKSLSSTNFTELSGPRMIENTIKYLSMNFIPPKTTVVDYYISKGKPS